MDFFKMSEPQRKAATSASYKILRRLADMQINLLNAADSNIHLLSERNHFISQMTKSFWRDFDFAYSLRVTKYDFYAVYPIRTMLEKLLKMVQFNKMPVEEQDEAVKKELLLEIKRNYDLSEEDDGLYDEVNSEGAYPNIKEVNDGELKVFQPYEQLCNNFNNKKNLYGFYRWLSGIPHGNLAHLMFQKTIGKSEYRRVMMMGIYFGFEMLLAVDIHFNNANVNEINDSFEEIKKIIGNDIQETILKAE